jgi:hypothetical protein
MKQCGAYSFLGAILAGAFMSLSATTTGAHTVPACCIGPGFTEPSDVKAFCVDREVEKDKAQAPNSRGGITVRSPPNNKHCQEGHVSPEGGFR